MDKKIICIILMIKAALFFNTRKIILISGKNSWKNFFPGKIPKIFFPLYELRESPKLFEREIKFPGYEKSIPGICGFSLKQFRGFPKFVQREEYLGNFFQKLTASAVYFGIKKYPGKLGSGIGNSRNCLSGKSNSRDKKNRSRKEDLDSRYFLNPKLRALIVIRKTFLLGSQNTICSFLEGKFCSGVNFMR